MVLALLVLVTLGLLWIASRVDAASVTGREGREGPPWVMVREGDTPWEVAFAMAPEGGPAVTVHRIAAVSGLPASVIRSGDRLRLPAGPAD
ncbi:LysM peptidoglycan-binding domain-containing protein [Planomonospora sp. ID67723]|uniref:LysM peptidoglycan-binding domain-containing protein n=1 Tax=Planomonospora sp. ID67723 TaxID=2738134 RepID=UPI0018C3FC1F|nr:LysM peptidoglycan-binding domain-containing protein [Planomonospora sp. ID67723]MBG0830573.1 LysM peptidoglycan-binding domain-containing protein [Planomonospora sp. ID67723]